MNGINAIDLVAEVEKEKLYTAQTAAVELRKIFADMRPMERAAARLTKEYRAIERLVEAVEQL
jgi:hypothetical protein